MTSLRRSRGRPSGWDTGPAAACLRSWTAAGVIGRFEVELVTSVMRAAGDVPSDGTLLALALVARATRLGHVCLDLETVHDQLVAARDDEGAVDSLVLPDLVAWRTELERSSIVAANGARGLSTDRSPVRPLVLEGSRLYLHRYWRFELEVTAQLIARSTFVDDDDGHGVEHETAVDEVLESLFGGRPLDEEGSIDLQFVAARRALTRPVTVIAGGPGTGKTHTVARILAAAHLLAARRGDVFRAALVAPTGKAAARMKEAVDSQVRSLESDGRIDAPPAAALLAIEPTTIHRLLGYATRTSFRHDRTAPLAHDLVVVDETSMVSLPLLAQLLDAVRPGARLVLVGDPFQLASIEAGTVMGDLVGPGDAREEAASYPLAGRVTELRRGHRFEAGSATAALALAIRDGDADRAIHQLSSGSGEVHWVRPDDSGAVESLRQLVARAATDVAAAAINGDGASALDAATRIKVLAAIRWGPLGLFEWTDLINASVQAAVPPAMRGGHPRVGTPVLVTLNDPVNRLANGDVGVVITAEDGRWVAIAGSSPPRRLAPARLGEWEPWWAMTIHKSQGSEFPHAVVSLPVVDSPILTRELLYTAVTRAKPEVTIVGTEEMIRVAISRPVSRASGLGDRLWPGA